FFFQAEDGIRDRNVTGVQTCALPISSDISIHIFIALASSIISTISIISGLALSSLTPPIEELIIPVSSTSLDDSSFEVINSKNSTATSGCSVLDETINP